MATIKTYENHVADLQQWLQDTATSATDDLTQRDWCTLDIDNSLIPDNIYSYFDTTTLNSDFQTEYNAVMGTSGQANGTFTNKPVMYNQADSDALDGLSKMFIYRHQPRLKNYRDDLENKQVRTYTSLSLAIARYTLLKNLNS